MKTLFRLLIFFCSVPGYTKNINKPAPSLMNIHVLNVGNAFCSLVECPGQDAPAIIYDCGTKTGRSSLDLTNTQINSYIKKVIAKKKVHVIISHPDFDHYSRLPLATKGLSVTSIWIGGKLSEYSHPYIKTWLKRKKRQKVPIYYGWTPTLKSKNNLKTQFSCGAAKVQLLAVNSGKTRNANSLMLQLQYNNFQAIFTGDATGVSEKQALFNFPNIVKNTDVLLSSHHGTQTNNSNSVEWLKTLQPKTVIYSTGNNRQYKHPKCEVTNKIFKYLRPSLIHEFSCYKNNSVLKIKSQESEFNTNSNGLLVVSSFGNNHTVTTSRD